MKQLIDPWFRVLRNCLPVICCYWRRCIYNCLPNLWVNKRGYTLSVRQFHNYRCGLLIRRLWLPVTSLQNYLSFITEPLIGIKVSIWNDLSNLIYTIFDEWREKWMKLQFFIFLYDKWDNYSLWPHTKYRYSIHPQMVRISRILPLQVKSTLYSTYLIRFYVYTGV